MLGTALATILSGVTRVRRLAVSIGLGAERLQLAARAAGFSPLSQGQPASDRMTGGSERTRD